MKIKEIIVVEGRDDTVAIKRAVDADTIETNGSAINEKTIERIRLAQETRGVIVLTDPDYPGEKIRKTIQSRVPGCKHAFINREDAKPKSGRRGIGVEHASIEAIRDALQFAQTETGEIISEISWDDCIQAGLVGGERATARRERLGDILKIGYGNAKQLYKRIQIFRITKEQFGAAIRQIIEEEQEHA